MSTSFIVEIARCNRNFHSNSFFFRTSELWNILKIFSLHDINNFEEFKSEEIGKSENIWREKGDHRQVWDKSNREKTSQKY